MFATGDVAVYLALVFAPLIPGSGVATFSLSSVKKHLQTICREEERVWSEEKVRYAIRRKSEEVPSQSGSISPRVYEIDAPHTRYTDKRRRICVFYYEIYTERKWL